MESENKIKDADIPGFFNKIYYNYYEKNHGYFKFNVIYDLIISRRPELKKVDTVGRITNLYDVIGEHYKYYDLDELVEAAFPKESNLLLFSSYYENFREGLRLLSEKKHAGYQALFYSILNSPNMPSTYNTYYVVYSLGKSSKKMLKKYDDESAGAAIYGILSRIYVYHHDTESKSVRLLRDKRMKQLIEYFSSDDVVKKISESEDQYATARKIALEVEYYTNDKEVILKH